MVPVLTLEAHPTSKRIKGLSSLGHLSRICCELRWRRWENLWFEPSDSRAMNYKFVRVSQTYGLVFYTSKTDGHLPLASIKLIEKWLWVHEIKETWHTVSEVWVEQMCQNLLQPPRCKHSRRLSVSQPCPVGRDNDIHFSGTPLAQVDAKSRNEICVLSKG